MFDSKAKTASVLDMAKDLVTEDRNKLYGNPDVNLARIAAVWNVLLEGKAHAGSIWLRAEDVAMLLCAMKLVREAHAPNLDNAVDAAAYAAMMAGVQRADH